MKLILTIIPTNLVTNSHLSLFGPLVTSENKIQIFRSGNKKYFIFFVYSESCHALLQRHADFNKLL